MSAETDVDSGAHFQVLEPFTPNEHADVIIRSGDGHDFHVLKGLLSFCSSIFYDMFSLPPPLTAPEHDAKPDLPIVEISESGAVTDILLRNIYPVDPPALVDDSLYSGVLSAAQKYDMKRVIDIGRRRINELCSGGDESVLRAYVLAYAHRLEAETRTAAFMSLRLCLLYSSLVHTLDPLPGRAVTCLITYHGKVGKQIAGVLSDVSMLPRNIATVISCTSCRGYTLDDYPRLQLPRWWDKASRSIQDVMYREGSLSAAAVSRQTFKDFAFGCNNCQTRLLQRVEIEDFVRIVRREMERVASEVKLEIPWET